MKKYVLIILILIPIFHYLYIPKNKLITSELNSINLESRLHVPSISLNLSIDNSPNLYSPWYWQYSDTPSPNHHLIVISGHSFTYSNPIYSPFVDLEYVSVGDDIEIEYMDILYKYIVTDIKIVLPNEVSVLSSSGGDNLILYTCYPKYISTHRLVIYSNLVSISEL